MRYKAGILMLEARCCNSHSFLIYNSKTYTNYVVVFVCICFAIVFWNWSTHKTTAFVSCNKKNELEPQKNEIIKQRKQNQLKIGCTKNFIERCRFKKPPKCETTISIATPMRGWRWRIVVVVVIVMMVIVVLVVVAMIRRFVHISIVVYFTFFRWYKCLHKIYSVKLSNS